MSIKISRSDIAKLDKKIKKLKEFDKRKLSKELGITALDISLRAKKASRVGQDAGGTLRQSIRAEVKGKSVSVIAGAQVMPNNLEAMVRKRLIYRQGLSFLVQRGKG